MNSLTAASEAFKLAKGRVDHTAAATMGHFSTTLPKTFTNSSQGRAFTVSMFMSLVAALADFIDLTIATRLNVRVKAPHQAATSEAEK